MILPSLTRCVQTVPGSGVALSTAEIPSIRPWEVLIQTQTSYISAGTELHVVRQARANAEGFENPITLGYSLVGVVRQIGCEVTCVSPGQRVVAIGTGAYHAEFVVVSHRLVTALPEGVRNREAAPMAMMAFAVEAVRKANLQFGHHVVVVGAGPMGQYVSQMASSSGCDCILIDPVESRLRAASGRVHGLISDEAFPSRISEHFGEDGVEVVFLCFGGDGTGVIQQLQGCMRRGPDGIVSGRVVCPGGVRLSIEMASASGNLEFVSSAKAGPGYRDPGFEEGASYTTGYVPWTVSRNLRVLVRALENGLLDSRGVVTHEVAFSDAVRAYATLESPPADLVGIVLNYE